MKQILTQAEIEEVWGPSAQASPRASFNLEDVPEGLRQLAPYAVFWGAADDWAREDVLKKTPDSLRKNLKAVIAAFDDALDAWLAGAEASNSHPSDAYVAFSAMRMSADFV
jgi:hypothetical protein